jgi:hypothetical protein
MDAVTVVVVVNVVIAVARAMRLLLLEIILKFPTYFRDKIFIKIH